MCELFGVSGNRGLEVNKYLKELAAHSNDHPNGWGMAVFYDNSVSLEKEPLKALQSSYLRERIRRPFEVKNMLGHIRLATKGGIDYENCHPFVKRDDSGRAWTLIHNGTIFSCEELNKFVHLQEGETDSERILYFIVDKINEKQDEVGRALTPKERFDVVDDVILTITPNNNKVNLLIYDGEQMYVHTNFKASLYQKNVDGSMLFATEPLDEGGWKPVNFMTLEAYKDGQKVYSGTKHENEYFFREEDMKFIYLDSSVL